MANTKYEGQRTITLAAGYAMEGCTNNEIAKKLGVSRSTLQLWAAQHPDLSDALKKNKEVVDFQVEQALLNKARAGDSTAMIFWLKNRRPKQWKDRPQEDTGATGRKVDDLIEVSTELAKGIVGVHE